MANAFEEFVQLELGKRPYTGGPGTEETLLVRRGPGPRQIEFLDIAEGELVGKVNGVLVGVPRGASGAAALFTHKQLVSDDTWAVEHNTGLSFFTYSVFDADGRSIVPDQVQRVDANSILVSFLIPISGHVVFSFDPVAG